MVGAWCFGCLWAHQGLPVGFHLLRYSVLFTVESLSLLYLLVISWLICFRRWCIDKLGVFHANQVSRCLDPHLNWGWGWCRWTGLSPPVKYFTHRSKAVFLLWIFYAFVLSCVCYVFVHVCLYVLRGHLLGKGWPLGSRLWCLTVSLSLFHWYPGSGVVLDCIDSWPLHPYLHFTYANYERIQFYWSFRHFSNLAKKMNLKT